MKTFKPKLSKKRKFILDFILLSLGLCMFNVLFPNLTIITILVYGLVVFYVIARYFTNNFQVRKEEGIFLFFIFLIVIITVYFNNSDLLGYDSISKMSQILDYNFTTAMILAAYTFFTLLMFIEMKRSREEQNKPKLIGRLEPLGSGATILRIKNVGKGSATEIKLNYKLTKLDVVGVEKKWSCHLLQPTEFARLIIEETNFVDFMKKYDKLLLNFEYNTDDFKTKIKEQPITINLKELLEGLTDNFWIQETTTEEDIHSIADRMREILFKLSNIDGSLRYLSQNNRKKSEKVIIQKIRKLKKKNK